MIKNAGMKIEELTTELFTKMSLDHWKKLFEARRRI